MSDSKPRGIFVLLEGVDRCGKTTQIERIYGALSAQAAAAAASASASASAPVGNSSSIPADVLVSCGVEKYRFPNRTTAIGQMINAYLTSSPPPPPAGASDSSPSVSQCSQAGSPPASLSDASVHLLFSANRWECAPSLVACLRSGRDVVCDRYAYSGVAFTASKKGCGTEHLNVEWC